MRKFIRTQKKEVVNMKSITVLLLSLLAFGLMSGSVDNAFAKGNWSPPPAAVANLVCSLSAATPPTFVVSAYSSANVSSSVTVTVGTEECAQALLDLLNSGLKINDVKVITPNIVYTLTNKEQ